VFIDLLAEQEQLHSKPMSYQLKVIKDYLIN